MAPRIPTKATNWTFRQSELSVKNGAWPCVAFVRLLQLIRLCRNEQEELAVEVVTTRHKVAVLRRQVARPALRPSHRTLPAGLSRLRNRRHPCCPKFDRAVAQELLRL